MLGELELQTRTAINLYVALDYGAVQPGQDWPAVRDALKQYLEGEAQQISEGRPRVTRPPGVPFNVTVWNCGSLPKPTRVAFGRFTIADDTLQQRVREQCDRKVSKLAPYKGQGYRTILLLENDDIGNMNHVKMAQTVMGAYPEGLPAGVDELWYISSPIQPELHFLDLSSIWSLPEGERFPPPTIWPQPAPL